MRFHSSAILNNPRQNISSSNDCLDVEMASTIKHVSRQERYSESSFSTKQIPSQETGSFCEHDTGTIYNVI